MSGQVTRNNHYVPVWYQRGFLAPGQSQFFYLDTLPEHQTLPDSRVVPSRAALKRWGPRKCFVEYDLYTTHFGKVVNDEIEKYLFGEIDAKGSRAVRAFIDGDLARIHESFSDFFEYLDAQKLRTPKGLGWIDSLYGRLPQVQLMREMQSLRLMHCAMWVECVREIVSAEDSPVKFIVTDHPVTVYNRAIPPGAAFTQFDGPSIELLGSQVVFALDSNTCLILTHLEYAQAPDRHDPTKTRTNVRFSGSGIARTDAFIRTRRLSSSEVVSINHLFKSSAQRYIAAATLDDLYPDKSFNGRWEDIEKTLLPRDSLWKFGGEMYVGYKDGTTYYQDAYGRTSKAHKHLMRSEIKHDLGPNDPCGCGSGKKFKQCCKGLSQRDRPSWEVYGIRERNLFLCRAIEDILGLSNGKSWDDVRRELSDKHVVEIHEVFQSLWPEETNLAELLPVPKDGTARALYLGSPNYRSIGSSLIGWLTYFDEVVMVHPFMNPVRMRPAYSPTKSPAQHKEQTLKNILLLLLLEPYIETGFVHLVPDPSDFNSQFGQSVINMAKERTSDWELSRSDIEQSMKLERVEFQMNLARLPEASIRRKIRLAAPEIDDVTLERVVAMFKSELEADWGTLLQPFEQGERGAQLRVMKSYNLEIGLFIATLTGAIIYTDQPALWKHLHEHTAALTDTSAPNWVSLSHALDSMEMPIEINPTAVLQARHEGRFGLFRSVLRRIVKAARLGASPSQLVSLEADLGQAYRTIIRELEQENKDCRLAGNMKLSKPTLAFNRPEVRRLLIKFGRADAKTDVPLAIYVECHEVQH